VLVVTPLLKGHKISKETKKTIKRNKTPIVWVTSEGNNNIPTNIQNGINFWKMEGNKLPTYLLPLDNDIILGRYMIDRLVKKIDTTDDNVAYAYASFEYKGHINKRFSAVPFNTQNLLRSNFISSNSLIKINHLTAVGGMVMDDKYKRLLDYCLWLKFLYNGQVGIPCPEAKFIAVSSKDDISAGTSDDYQLKYQRVLQDFIQPVIDKYSK
jgi:hypothetical protein